jgi:hypothetical protein
MTHRNAPPIETSSAKKKTTAQTTRTAAARMEPTTNP